MHNVTGIAPGTAGPAISETAWCRSFPATLDQVGEARRFVATLLGANPVTDDAVRCVSELAANACAHSRSALPGGTFQVRMRRSGAAARFEVTDAGGPWGTRPDGIEHGRGPNIVRRTASRTGIAIQGDRHDPDQRTIWFELPL